MSQKYTTREEIANSITHGIGTGLGITALVLMIFYSVTNGSSKHVISSVIYGSTLIFLYLSSTLYHAIPFARAKGILQKIDHSSIFILIAGTYTPFTLVSLEGGWGWSLFGTIWGLALLGIILEVSLKNRNKALSLFLYVLMGWLIIIAIKPMLDNVEPKGLILLAGGGVIYSLGIAFYVWHQLPFNHAIWHIFVLAGSILQFFSIFYFVIP